MVSTEGEKSRINAMLDAGMAGPKKQVPIRGIYGVVRLQGSPPAMQAPRTRKDHHFCMDKLLPHNAVRVTDGRLADVLVTLDGDLPEEDEERDWPPQQLRYQGCEIKPRIVPLMVEQILQIHNGDATMHIVNARHGVDVLFNDAQPRGAPRLQKSFDQTGLVRVMCNVHPWERSFIYVSPHRHVAVSDAQGAFHLPEVPPGSYRLKTWHSQYGWQQRNVRLAHGTTKVNIDYRTDMHPSNDNIGELDGLF